RWLQRDNRFKHRQRRGIGRCIGLSSFAKNGQRFRNFLQLSILYLKNFCRLSDRHSGNGRWHVKERAFIERRHEFAPEPFEWDKTHRDNEQSEEQWTPDAFRGGDDHARALRSGWLATILIAKMFQRLVRVLDHDDRRIDHRTDGDGDSA